MLNRMQRTTINSTWRNVSKARKINCKMLQILYTESIPLNHVKHLRLWRIYVSYDVKSSFPQVGQRNASPILCLARRWFNITYLLLNILQQNWQPNWKHTKCQLIQCSLAMHIHVHVPVTRICTSTNYMFHGNLDELKTHTIHLHQCHHVAFRLFITCTTT